MTKRTARGSSPRLRGTLKVDDQQLIATLVHPRACGERLNITLVIMRSAGSSPRLRGTHCRLLAQRNGRRFIPAPAGNALPVTVRRWGFPVHPRACGERYSYSNAGDECDGSSPRLRGTRLRHELRRLLRRFIPAPAGNAWHRLDRRCYRPVHPRACGERCPMLDGVEKYVGSSPRLRGTRREYNIREQQARFIPAPAGNAEIFTTGDPFDPVHPRACGERPVGLSAGLLAHGSSPRLRGTLEGAEPGRLPTAVHPRACGERAVNTTFASSRRGSSPRLRGTRKASSTR